MSNIQQKHRLYAKNRKPWLTYKKQKQGTEITFEWSHMLDIVDKDFKAAIINMFKEPKESLLKEVKENVMTVSYQIENIINTEINYLKNGNFEVEKYNWDENFIEGVNNRFKLAEESISELHYRSIEMMQSEGERLKNE